VWFAPVLGLAGAVVGGALGPSLTSHLHWRQARRTAFVQAIAAVRKAQALRDLATGVQADVHGGTPEEISSFNRAVRERGIERFIDAMYEAKVALAALEPYYVPSIAIDRWEIAPEVGQALMAELRQAK
jgi:hypothetical protein